MTTARDHVLDAILTAAVEVAEAMPTVLVESLATVELGEIGEAFESALRESIRQRGRKAA